MHIPRPRVSRQTLLLAALVVLVAVLATVTFAIRSSGSDNAVTTRDARVTLPESPGSTSVVDLDTRLYVPKVTPAPAVLLAHGFGGDKFSVAGQAQKLADQGFVVLTYSARGFGASTGLISLNEPNREVADGRGLIDYLAKQPEVQLDAPGDPHVGVAGGSYGGALALSLGGTDKRIDAVAAAITWNDLGQALFPNFGVENAASAAAVNQAKTPAASGYGGPGVLKRSWAGIFFGVGSAPSTDAGSQPAGSSGAAPAPASAAPTASACGKFAPEFCSAYAEAAVTGKPSQQLLDLLTSHSPVTVAASIKAPTLLVQGEQDTLFGLDQADATARQIASAGGSVQVRWFDGGHDDGGTSAASDDAIGQFLNDKLRGSTSTATAAPFVYSLQGMPAAQRTQPNRPRTAPDYPGLAADSATQTMAVKLTAPAPTQSILRPPGASPSAISSLPGLGSALSALSSTTAGAALSADLPGQTAIFRSEPLSAAVTITGTPKVNLTVSSQAAAGGSVLFAKLYDVSESGQRTLPGGGVSAVRLPDGPAGVPQNVSVALPGISYSIAQGHHLELAVSTTDQAYAVPLEPAQFTVALSDANGGADLTVPTVPAVATGRTVPIAPFIGIGLLALLIAAVITVSVVRTRRRAVAEVNPDLIDTPLVITNLAKTYSNGFKAVDNVSFEVRTGQVLGLLGPNGAGKTTTLRMLMGLISPTGGEIRVFGHKVKPGAPVLSRLGSFVEGSGFLPHLSGMENLKLYWDATGRPAEDAHLAEALEIADLGTAIERKVKSYSQGMRQRLAIAQAMLGLPDLMVLDEPTNGLDPPQIRTMRDVLINYARTGRTVLVSSHLLSEVEQTCTHVVVMNRGSVISSGTVHDLTSGGGMTEIRVDDTVRAMSVLADLLKDSSEVAELTESDDVAIRVNLESTDSAEVIRSLVGAGIGVRSLSQSTRLEDVFLDLVDRDNPSAATKDES